MLTEIQIGLLDQGLWIVPLLGVSALVVFPWKHWASIIQQTEQREQERGQ